MNMNLKGIMPTLGAKPGQVVSDPYARAFAPQPQVEVVKEAEDHEVSMAQNSLDTIIKMATELKAKMGESEKDIPAWIQDHITNAENFISQASSNYHEYGNSNEVKADEIKVLSKEEFIKEANTISAPGEWVAYLSMTRGKKLLKTFNSARGAKQYLSKNVSTLLGGSNVESVGIMTKKEWDEREAKYAIESIKEARLTDIVRSIVETPAIGKPIHSKINEAKKYDIGSGYMGNGLTIWNRAEEEHGDYKIIAHISPQGKLSVRDKQLPADLKKMFQIWADSMAKGNMGPKH